MTAHTIEAVGEIDTSTAPELRTRLYEAIDANPGSTITIDMGGLEFMDSTGLGVLVAGLKHARTKDGDVVLANTPPQIWKLFTITGLDKVFTNQAPG
jgi:anti-sigma B factor antagonist